MKIIGISGKIQSGKSTLADHMLPLLDGDWQKVSFAFPLKKEVSTLFNFPLHWGYSEEGKTKVLDLRPLIGAGLKHSPPALDMTVRELLQWWGTDVRRANDPNYWNRAMIAHLNHMKRDYGKTGVIIDDVRFVNEAQCIREFWKGYLIRVEHYSKCTTDDIPHKTISHASEVDLDDYERFNKVYAPEFGTLKSLAQEAVNDYAWKDANEPKARYE